MESGREGSFFQNLHQSLSLTTWRREFLSGLTFIYRHQSTNDCFMLYIAPSAHGGRNLIHQVQDHLQGSNYFDQLFLSNGSLNEGYLHRGIDAICYDERRRLDMGIGSEGSFFQNLHQSLSLTTWGREFLSGLTFINRHESTIGRFMLTLAYIVPSDHDGRSLMFRAAVQGWSNPPADVLREIARRVTRRAFIRMCLVCRSWKPSIDEEMARRVVWDMLPYPVLRGIFSCLNIFELQRCRLMCAAWRYGLRVFLYNHCMLALAETEEEFDEIFDPFFVRMPSDWTAMEFWFG